MSPDRPLLIPIDPPDYPISEIGREAEQLEFATNTGASFGIHRAEGVLTTPFRFLSAQGNGTSCDFGRQVASEVGALSGCSVQFETATFLLYESDCFVGAHVDRRNCDFNLLTLVAGSPTVFSASPELADVDLGKVLQLSVARDGFLEDSAVIPVSEIGSGVLFEGRRIPHQRKHPASPVMLLSLCYTLVRELPRSR